MRLGAYPAVLAAGSLVAEAYGSTEVSERHRHRYEVNNAYRDVLERGRAGHLRYLAGRPAGRVRRTATRGASVLRGHPGAPGAEVATDPAAPAVRCLRRGRAELQRGRTVAGRDCPSLTRSSPPPARSPMTDQPAAATDFTVVSTESVFHGYAFEVRADQVRMPDGAVAQRDVVEHSARWRCWRIDDDDQVCMVWQYRHPVRQQLLELPAGLLDVAGEPALDTAKRELYEEASLRADDWQVLIDLHTSPGMTRRGDPGLPGPRPGRGSRARAFRGRARGTVDDRAALSVEPAGRDGAGRRADQRPGGGRGAGRRAGAGPWLVWLASGRCALAGSTGSSDRATAD